VRFDRDSMRPSGSPARERAQQLRPKCRAAVELRFTQDFLPGDRGAPRVPTDGEEVVEQGLSHVDAAWRRWVKSMNSNEEKIRAAIAESRNGSCETTRAARCADSAALAAWLKTSPVHVEEFLGVSAIARDLKEARRF